MITQKEPSLLLSVRKYLNRYIYREYAVTHVVFRRYTCHVTESGYYTWPSEDLMAEWQRLDPIIKSIVTGE